ADRRQHHDLGLGEHAITKVGREGQVVVEAQVRSVLLGRGTEGDHHDGLGPEQRLGLDPGQLPEQHAFVRLGHRLGRLRTWRRLDLLGTRPRTAAGQHRQTQDGRPVEHASRLQEGRLVRMRRWRGQPSRHAVRMEFASMGRRELQRELERLEAESRGRKPPQPPASLGERLLGLLRATRHPIRALAMAMAALALAWGMATSAGLTAAMLGAVAGVAGGELLGRTKTRLIALVIAVLLFGAAGWWMADW